ncbi:MAG: T9SS type A sorting domain-containing protein [Chitinophagales bacterium]
MNNGSSDACGVASLALDNSSFTCANVGSGNTVVLTVTDVNTNTSTCTATVTVQDNVAPVAVCQDVTVQLDNTGNGSTTASSVNNGSSDACGVASLALDNSSFTCANVGSGNTVVLTVTDVNTNTSTCTATVTVQDNVAPVAVCQNVTVQLDNTGNGSTTASSVNNGSSDACGVASLGLDNSSFTCSNVGSGNTVVLTVTDVNGNSTTCSATVTVQDNVAPVAVCQDVTVQLDNAGNGSTTANAVNNGSSDACGIATKVLSKTSFTCANVGTNPVVLTVTDVNGNSTTCSATVTVQDNVAPVAVCQNVTVNLDNTGNGSTTANAVNNGSSDACGIATKLLSKTTFTCANVGANPVVLTVTDINGNSTTCSATVTVRDLVAPIALCQNVTVNLDNTGNGSTTANAVNNGSSDACGIATKVLSKTSFNCSNVGANPVVLTVTDVNGNSTTCSATVTVRDLIAPVALCKNVTVALDATGNASVTPAQLNNNSTDACGIASLTINSTSLATFNCTNTGTNTITLKVTDVNGNTSTCVSTVTVTGGALYNYVILAEEKVHLHNSNIQSGGIGIMTAGGEAEIEKYTTVTAPGTFVQSPDIDINTGGAVTTKIYTVASAPLPVFETNPYTSNNNIKVLSGQTVTLNDSLYNEIKVEKYGTIIFTQPVVNIRKLETKEYAVIKFNQCTKMRLKEHFHMKRNSMFNPDGLGVTVFAQKHVEIKEGSKVFATLYAKDEHIHVEGKANSRTQMTGLFIAKRIDKGDYTDWNANTQCGKCSVSNSLFARISDSKDVNCDGAMNGSATVSVTGGTAPYTYSWNTVPVQTTATAINLGVGSYTVTVTDALGATATVTEDINVFNYTILATDEINIGKNDTVYSGSVGITKVNGKIRVDDKSSIAGDNAIAIAPIIDIDPGSTANDTVYGIAVPLLNAFEGNITYSSSSDINVPNNTIMTLTTNDTLRRKVTIGDNATLIVSAGVLNITDKLELKKNSKIRFTSGCAKVRIKNDFTTGENPTINPDGVSVVFHVNGSRVDISNNAKVTATIYAPNATIDVAKASASTPNIMTGKFIGKKVNSGEYTYWNENTACPCNSSSGGPVFFNSIEQTPATNQLTPSNPNTSVDLTSRITSIQVSAYPNPFKDNATIKFALPEYNNNVKLSIFNMEGRDIKLLYDGPAEGNVEYQFQINADHTMDSGIYFYRLETKEGKTIVNKLILIK